MKKLCLILTVLYAIWANCSAQSLNIAGNLLDSNSSTFESGSSSWTCYDKDAWSIASESGRNGNYLKLTDTGASHDYDKQMEYSLSGHTPAEGKNMSSSSGRKKMEPQALVKSGSFFRKTP